MGDKKFFQLKFQCIWDFYTLFLIGFCNSKVSQRAQLLLEFECNSRISLLSTRPNYQNTNFNKSHFFSPKPFFISNFDIAQYSGKFSPKNAEISHFDIAQYRGKFSQTFLYKQVPIFFSLCLPPPKLPDFVSLVCEVLKAIIRSSASPRRYVTLIREVLKAIIRSSASPRRYVTLVR